MEISASLTLPPSPSLPQLPSPAFSASRSTLFTGASSLSLSIRIKTAPDGSGNSLGISRGRANRASRGLTCNALFGLGVPELVVIVGVAALVFGPKKLPEVGKSIGKTVKSFQQAAKEFESELKKEPDSISESSATKPRVVSEEKKEDPVPSSKEST